MANTAIANFLKVLRWFLRHIQYIIDKRENHFLTRCHIVFDNGLPGFLFCYIFWDNKIFLKGALGKMKLYIEAF